MWGVIMRMRKKKYLDERLAQCDNIIKLFSDDRNFQTAIEKKEYIDTEALFGNSNPVVLEVGCGKGKFACELAKQNPDINLVAVEKSGNVIVEACEKTKEKNQKILYDIIENKTAKLIMAPVLSASKIAENKHFDELKEFSYNLGVLFQIIDDVMDEVGSLSLIGKTPHKDKEADKLTAVKIFGLEGAKRQAKIHYEKCVQALKNVENSEFLIAFANKIFKRNK